MATTRPIFLRSAIRLPAKTSTVRCASFHTSRYLAINVGDSLPDVELMEDSPGNKVNLSKEFAKDGGKGIVIGVPAAFSPSCSNSHIPGYMAHPSLASAGSVYVVSVNDAFVMKAWKDALVAGSVSGSKIHFLADPSAAFTNAVQMAFDDAKAIFGGERSKRYAIVVEEGKVQSVHVEPDNTGVDVSAAEKVLG